MNLLLGINKINKVSFHVGLCALLRSIWNCKNVLVFKKTGNFNYLYVIHHTMYWIHASSFLLLVEQRESMYY